MFLAPTLSATSKKWRAAPAPAAGHSHVKLERVGCLVLLHLEPVTLQHEVIIPHFYQGLNLHTNKEGFYM